MDRGSFSCEVIFSLLAYKLLFPEHMHLTRGNHESKSMNKVYGFDGEVSQVQSYRTCPVQRPLCPSSSRQPLPVANPLTPWLRRHVFNNHGCNSPQVKAKYNGTMVDCFRELFCALPLSYCLNGRVLVLHGGLFSNDGVTLEDLRKVDRFR